MAASVDFTISLDSPDEGRTREEARENVLDALQTVLTPTRSSRARHQSQIAIHTATGIRTPVSAVRGRRPSPLDDSGEES